MGCASLIANHFSFLNVSLDGSRLPQKTLAEARRKIVAADVTARDMMQQMEFRSAGDYAKVGIMRCGRS